MNSLKVVTTNVPNYPVRADTAGIKISVLVSIYIYIHIYIYIYMYVCIRAYDKKLRCPDKMSGYP